jgi:hypothetical protein
MERLRSATSRLATARAAPEAAMPALTAGVGITSIVHTAIESHGIVPCAAQLGSLAVH